MHHIKNTLPEIKNKIQANLQKSVAELQQLGDPLVEDESSNVIIIFLISSLI